jgi:hypothetical protein
MMKVPTASPVRLLPKSLELSWDRDSSGREPQHHHHHHRNHDLCPHLYSCPHLYFLVLLQVYHRLGSAVSARLFAHQPVAQSWRQRQPRLSHASWSERRRPFPLLSRLDPPRGQLRGELSSRWYPLIFHIVELNVGRQSDHLHSIIHQHCLLHCHRRRRCRLSYRPL